ncbi:uncharacterized protein [Temnothorax nylanderi]|uniref:uncharacterized protein n=1 Tax=Temnothorax nylanderi TaxID=102681 RepID=UPI003A84D09F
MMKHGHNVTGAQCLSKFSGLKRTYKAVKDHNNKSGNGTRSWTYFSHMDTLLGEKPFMSPVSIVSSTGKRTLSQSECTSSDDSCSSTNEKPKKLRQTSNTEKLIEDLKEDKKLTEGAIKRRHKKTCRYVRDFLTHLKKW